jgi:hypothetical protein
MRGAVRYTSGVFEEVTMNEVSMQIAPFQQDSSVFVAIAVLGALIIAGAMYKGFREWQKLIEEANAEEGESAPRKGKGKGKARARVSREADQAVDQEMERRKTLSDQRSSPTTEQAQDAIDDALAEAQ